MPQKIAGTIPVYRVNLDEVTRHQQGRAGLWAGKGNSFFDNPRRTRTVDPTDHERSLTKMQRAYSPLREGGKGRVVV